MTVQSVKRGRYDHHVPQSLDERLDQWVEETTFAKRANRAQVARIIKEFVASPDKTDLVFSGLDLSELPLFLDESSLKSRVKELFFTNCRFSTLPRGLFQLSELKKLSIEQCPLFREIPIEIENLTKLIEVDIYHVPSELEDLPDLALPRVFFRLRLEKLSISGFSIDDHIGFLSGMNSLQRLLLNNSDLTEIPSELSQIESLTHLDLCANCIEEISESVLEFTDLEELALNQTTIRAIAPHLFSLPASCTISLLESEEFTGEVRRVFIEHLQDPEYQGPKVIIEELQV